MSDFRTTFTIPTHPTPLSHKDGILLIGSCFSESIGNLLHYHKVPTHINPLGTLFNPISIFETLQCLVSDTTLDPVFHTEQDDIWFHYGAHSSIKGENEVALKANIDSAIGLAKSFIPTAKTLVITFGTSYVYEHLASGKIVANCHKTPQKEFQKRLLTVSEIIHSFENIYPHLSTFENIILTVSPVRHTKDTVPLNSVSKSILRIVCHQLQEQHVNVSYFPSFELLMDDLRDYRYYKDDFIHPTDFAVHYVWEKFQETYFNPTTCLLFKEIESIQKSLSHRPFNTNTKSFLEFQESVRRKMEKLSAEVDFSVELNQLKVN